MSDDVKNETVQEEGSRDIFGIVAIVLVAAALFLGTIPIIGSPIRLVAGAIAAGIGVAGIVEGKRKGRRIALSVAGAIIGIVFFAWSLFGFTAVTSIISSLLSQA